MLLQKLHGLLQFTNGVLQSGGQEIYREFPIVALETSVDAHAILAVLVGLHAAPVFILPGTCFLWHIPPSCICRSSPAGWVLVLHGHVRHSQSVKLYRFRNNRRAEQSILACGHLTSYLGRLL